MTGKEKPAAFLQLASEFNSNVGCLKLFLTFAFCRSSRLGRFEKLLYTVDILDEVNGLVGITPFVIVPGDDLDEVIV